MGEVFSCCDFLAGWSGGILGMVVGHPLDTVKVRQQILPVNSSILSIVKSTYKVEGVFGFFKGMSYPLLGSGIYNAVFFGVYGNCLRWLQGISGAEVRKMCCEGDPPNKTWHRDVFIAGCVGGTMTVLYSCPLEVIKIKLQAQTDTPAMKLAFEPHLIDISEAPAELQMELIDLGEDSIIKSLFNAKKDPIEIRNIHAFENMVAVYFPASEVPTELTIPTRAVSVCKNLSKTEPIYKGPYDAMVQIYKLYGIPKGLYRGTWTMMWRDVPTFGLYTLSYEHILCWFKAKEDRSSHTSVTSQIVAGGIAGVLSWVTVAPLDVIKSRIQADDFGCPIYRGMIDCFKKTLHQDGVKALFLGLVLASLRSFPVNSAVFVGYEFVIKLCEKYDHQRKSSN